MAPNRPSAEPISVVCFIDEGFSSRKIVDQHGRISKDFSRANGTKLPSTNQWWKLLEFRWIPTLKMLEGVEITDQILRLG
jgi:hypothetical protein